MPPRKRKPAEPPKPPVTDEEKYTEQWHDKDGNPVYHQPSPKPV